MSKTWWILAMICIAGPVTGLQAQEEGAGDEASVEAVVVELFALMKAGDAESMAALMHSDARLATTGITPEGEPFARVVPIQGWLEGVAGSTRELDERIHGTEVRVEDNLATVWTWYDLYVDGVHSHCGVDAFQLVRTAEGWKILQVTDTRRREGCGG
ncbi:MAG: nuclear transport factor 2 family protein [Gemmatimonadota bacterium]|nr:nuclear transport factor 2 family protein [Gemmatimonadota bacterium]MDH5758797.1 nuclear transport factor 2 family protein [Gemmatimonadota bacterium]